MARQLRCIARNFLEVSLKGKTYALLLLLHPADLNLDVPVVTSAPPWTVRMCGTESSEKHGAIMELPSQPCVAYLWIASEKEIKFYTLPKPLYFGVL